MIKAIETVYNGYRFRSRLEARWAVFFDTLGVKYEYEKEGYNLDGTWYLPDFWLPEQKCYIEIKGQEPTQDEVRKAEALSEHKMEDVHIFYGDIEIPSTGQFYRKIVSYIIAWKVSNPMVLPVTEGETGWAQCPWCLSLNITYHSNLSGLPCECYEYIRQILDRKPLRTLLKHYPDIAIKEPKIGNKPLPFDFFYTLALEPWWRDKTNALLYAGDTPRLIAAYTAARQARFEHGESGSR